MRSARTVAVLAVLACAAANGAAAQDKTYTVWRLRHVHATAPIPPAHERCMKFVDDYLVWAKAGFDRGFKLPATRGWLAKTYVVTSERDWGVPAQTDAAKMAEETTRDLPGAKTQLDEQKASVQKARAELKRATGLARPDWQQTVDIAEHGVIVFDSNLRLIEAKAAFARCALENAGKT